MDGEFLRPQQSSSPTTLVQTLCYTLGPDMKAAFVALAAAAVANARTFTVYNGCPFTIWWVSFLCVL